MKKMIIALCLSGLAGCAGPQNIYDIEGMLISGSRCAPGSFANTWYFKYCPPIRIKAEDGTVYQLDSYVDASIGTLVTVNCSKGPVCDRFAYRK